MTGDGGLRLTADKFPAEAMLVWCPARPHVRVEFVDKRFSCGDLKVPYRVVLNIIQPEVSQRARRKRGDTDGEPNDPSASIFRRCTHRKEKGEIKKKRQKRQKKETKKETRGEREKREKRGKV